MNTVKYIGIRGHRGSGKISISYLIANALEYLIDFKEFGDDFDGLYKGWCDNLMNDEQDAVYNIDTPHVYLESFGDLPKMLTEMLTSIPHEYIYSDYYKDHIFIDVKTMDYIEMSDKESAVTTDRSVLSYIRFGARGLDKVNRSIVQNKKC
jgi:hypothetical protein